MTTKLAVWNAALRELASAPLADTTTANTRQFELGGAWPLAIEHTLAMRDWGFARRRATLTGIADTSFPPYTYRFTKPSDYLRKCWIKSGADEEYQLDHAEIAAVFYGLYTTGLLEYISNDAANYDPTNWPPHFVRVLTLYLASLVGPKLARAGADDLGRLNGQMQSAMAGADEFEAVFLTNTAIPVARQPVLRRALEFIGQQLAGSVPIHAHTDMMRWHMNRAWDHAVKYVLEKGAWNFATRRAILYGGIAQPPAEQAGLTAGLYWWLPMLATSPPTDVPAVHVTEFAYGYDLPTNFLHKIWVRADPQAEFECRYQFMGKRLFTDSNPTVIEYIASDAQTVDPANWTANFLEVVAAYLALLVTPELVLVAGKDGNKVNANQIKGRLEQLFMQRMSDAQIRDAIQQQPKDLPRGRFIRSRAGSTGGIGLRQYR